MLKQVKTRKPLAEPLEARCLLAAEIVINEIMYHANPNDSRLEFIELYNPSPEPRSLEGWKFTNGIEFEFTQASIAANGFLVVAADIEQFQNRYPNVENLVGNWHGRLANRGESITLVNAPGDEIDHVRYADQGEWAQRVLDTDDGGFRGWKWVADHDGHGNSLELQNPALANQFGHNWKSSHNPDGTPGAPNSVLTENITPGVTNVRHHPAIPDASTPVTVSVDVLDEHIQSVMTSLHFRVDGTDNYFQFPMESQTTGNTDSDYRTFVAEIPAQTHLSIVEFFVVVVDASGRQRKFPNDHSDQPDRSANLLYQVLDDAKSTRAWDANDQPIHYLVLRSDEQSLLADIGDGPLAQAQSNARMNGTLIRVDGNSTEIRYNVGIRNRGGSSRIGPPNNYRIHLTSDSPLDGDVSINLNSRFVHAQILGSVIHQMAGLPAAQASPVQVRVNGVDLAEAEGPRMFGSYAHMEVVTGSFPDNHFPDDRRGNLYRAVAVGAQDASLRYLGPDAEPYRILYSKRTNEELDDWSDLIELTRILNEAPDENYLGLVAEVLDVAQWLRYIALDSLLGNRETGLSLGTGDNYWLYRGIRDTRFNIIPHDLDTILGRARLAEPNRSIFAYTAVDGLARFLTHPEIVPLYYQAFLDLIDEVYNPETLHPLFDQVLGPFVDQDEIDEMKQFVVDRIAGVRAQLPQEFSITSQLPMESGFHRTTQPAAELVGTANALTTKSVSINGVLADWSPVAREWSVQTGGEVESHLLVEFGDSWKYLDDGTNQQSRWIRADYDDQAWRSGAAPLGYGNGDEATQISFGANPNDKFVTSYFRRTFTIKDLPSIRDLNLRLNRDDGAVVYLNGNEIVRSNMPEGQIDYQTVASSWIGGGLEGVIHSFSVDTRHLVDGLNVLAVEIHQRSPIDDDVTFDLQLEAVVGMIEGGVPLLPGINRLHVEAYDQIDGEGGLVDTEYIDIWYDGAIGQDHDTCNSYSQYGELQPSAISGELDSDWVLAPCGAAYQISDDLVVPVGTTLTIMPGTTLFFDAGAKIRVNGGRLVAEGTSYQPIRFTKNPVIAGAWEGIQFENSMEHNRLTHVIVEHAVTANGMIGLNGSRLHISNTTFDHTDRFRIRSVDSSLTVRDSTFLDIFDADQPPTTDNRSEHIWGSGIAAGGEWIIENNYFGTTKGHNDAIDFDGAQRPGPIPWILNNYFAGSGDDALDLEADAHVEGNTFANIVKDEYNDSTGDANAISAGNGRDYVVVRNVFQNVDHAVQVKDDAFLEFQNNTVFDVGISAIYFDLPDRTPGKGAWITDSIFHATKATLAAADQAEILAIHRSIVTPEALPFGTDNQHVDPRFVDAGAGDFRLATGSPAALTGNYGTDRGAKVARGAVIIGEPETETHLDAANLRVVGAGIRFYQYRVNDAAWSDVRSVDQPIELTGLNDGTYYVEVIGQDASGRWQSVESANRSKTWTVHSNRFGLRINEILADNRSSFEHAGQYSDAIELYNASNHAVDLSGMSLTDDPNRPRRFVFPDGIEIAGDSFVVLHADDLNRLPGVHLGFSLNSKGEGVFLFDQNEALVDAVEFGHQIHDYSIGRIGSDAMWDLNQPTLGAPNRMQPTGDENRLRINEWLADNEVRFGNDFVELFNADTLPVDMSGLYLTDNLAARPNQHAIANLSFIESQGFAAFQADARLSDADHLSFRLDREGEQIALQNALHDLIDQVIFFAQITDRSQGRVPDGADEIHFARLATPGQSNPIRQLRTRNLLAWNSTWKLEQSGEPQPADWIHAEFDDQFWDQGPGVFAEQTDRPFQVGTVVDTGIVTHYFRSEFEIDDEWFALNDVELSLSMLIDDGAIVYLNGIEFLRIGLPDGEVNHATRANRGIRVAKVEGPFPIPDEWLRLGTNTVAVELHQISPGSADVTFGLSADANWVLSDPQVDRAVELLDGLRVSELMYHPETTEGHEFIEVTNISDEIIDLKDVRLTGGVDFVFQESALAPGEFAVIVSDANSFRQNYGDDIRVLGEYSGQLRNSSEAIEFQLPPPFDVSILQFEYSDQWYPITDGDGFSLQVIDLLEPPAAWRSVNNWRPSNVRGGSPGKADSTISADFNQDGTIDTDDIDLLCQEVRSGGIDVLYDLNDDQLIDHVDLDYLLRDILRTGPGDANLDGRFNSTDLVLVFQLAEYEDGEIKNSTWRTGDWNCDGEFDSSDLVRAFQSGAYSEASVPIVDAISAAWLGLDDEDNQAIP